MTKTNMSTEECKIYKSQINMNEQNTRNYHTTMTGCISTEQHQTDITK